MEQKTNIKELTDSELHKAHTQRIMLFEEIQNRIKQTQQEIIALRKEIVERDIQKNKPIREDTIIEELIQDPEPVEEPVPKEPQK